MRVLIQRVQKASVHIHQELKGEIKQGLLIFLAIGKDDQITDIDYLVRKILHLRIFSDQEGKMNLSVQDIAGEILLISQFTLYASTKKGNRPSYTNSALPDKAKELYSLFIKAIEEERGAVIQTGVFGADMQVSLLNDGPVTIKIDSQNKE